MNTSVLNFLNANSIKYFPINLDISYNSSKKKYEKHIKYTSEYMPKFTDFKDLDPEKITDRHKLISKYDYIAIDTFNVYQIDVDTDLHKKEVEDLKTRYPYFESASKKLPHFFVTSDYVKKLRIQSKYEGIEVLTGQWSFCSVDAIVHNSDFGIKPIDSEFFLSSESKPSLSGESKPSVKTECSYDILEKVVMGLPILSFEAYNDWFVVVCAIVSTGIANKYERKACNLAHKWSEQSLKYDEDFLDKIIQDVIQKDDTKDERATYASLCYHLKIHNFELFKDLCVEKATYEKVKETFERECFKIKYNGEYGIFRGSKLEIYNRARFTEVFCELMYYKPDKKGGSIKSSFIKDWYLDENKRFYDYVDFLPPPQICNENIFNLWNGVPAEKSKVAYTTECDDILHLISVLCNDHEESIEYVLNWLADIIQNPGKKCGTAIVFKSIKEGCGKGTLLEIFRKILGEYVGETSNPQQDIFGSHGNVHVGKLLVALDEVGNSDTCKLLGRLKNIITSNKCIYNEKGVKQLEVNNNCRFIFTTNKSIPVSLNANDRRFCLIESSNKYCKNYEFWTNYYTNVVNNPSKINGFYHFLKERNIAGVNWMEFPKTELRTDVIQATLHPMVYWFDTFIQGMENDIKRVTATELYASYKLYCTGNDILFKMNVKSFGLAFKDNIDLTECDIIRGRGSAGVHYKIDRIKVFSWLQTNEYSNYGRIGDLEFIDDDAGL